MALSPYTKPTDPWKPNGIAHYVAKADRPTVKALWDTWVESYHLVTRHNDNATGPITAASVYFPGNGYVVSSGATFNLTASGGVIQTATVSTGGTNYVIGQRLYISGGSGSGGILTVATVSGIGAVLTVTISSPGTGYANTETSLATAVGQNLSYYELPAATLGSYETGIGTGVNAAISVLTTSSGGGISTISITVPGTSYRIGDILLVSAPGSLGVLIVTNVSFTPEAYPAAFDYAGLYTDGAP